MTSHQTEKTTIKTADIDREIIPVINWLNSHDFLITLYSCEGREEGDEEWSITNDGNINSAYRPYISFFTYSYIKKNNCSPDKIRQLKNIMDLLSRYGEFDLDDYDSSSKNGRFNFYCFRFHDKPTMREFIEKELKTSINKKKSLLSGVFRK